MNHKKNIVYKKYTKKINDEIVGSSMMGLTNMIKKDKTTPDINLMT